MLPLYGWKPTRSTWRRFARHISLITLILPGRFAAPTPPLPSPHLISSPHRRSVPPLTVLSSTLTALALMSKPIAAADAPIQLPPSTTASSVLSLFVSTDDVRERYTAVVDRYATRLLALKRARDSFDKFQKACSTDTAGHIKLPRSLALNLVTSARFDAVEGDPAFYKEATDAITLIDHTATDAFHQALVAAKQKHLTHIEERAKQNIFMDAEITSHRIFVTVRSVEYDLSAGPGSFPTEAAMAHFTQHLVNELPKATLSAAMNAIEQREKARAAAVIDSAAREIIDDGTHNGQTIASVATKAVRKELSKYGNTPVHAQRTHSDKRKDTDKPRSSDSSSAPPALKKAKQADQHRGPVHRPDDRDSVQVPFIRPQSSFSNQHTPSKHQKPSADRRRNGSHSDRPHQARSEHRERTTGTAGTTPSGGRKSKAHWSRGASSNRQGHNRPHSDHSTHRGDDSEPSGTATPTEFQRSKKPKGGAKPREQ